ncbi:MAG: outer membrane beta-barrel protein [Gallionella sp.]|jgi:OOP family OmpA-OmpF porin
MNKSTMTFALAAALFGMTAVHAGEFDGVWLGAKLGSNQSDFSGLDKKSATAFGLEGGYNWNIDSFLLGVAVFADLNGRATHNPGLVRYGSSAYGLDGKFGLPMGNWLPYAKLGYEHTAGDGGASLVSGNGVHLGLGAEYKFMPSLSVAGEFTNASAKAGAIRLNNNNFTLGINYYFDAVTAAPVEPVARFVSPVENPAMGEETKVVVKEQQKEVWKTLLEEKPVTFTGVNFDTKSARLLPSAIVKLDDVVEFSKLYPDAQLQITGHTDYRAGKSKKGYNQKLSERRAEVFKAALVDKGVSADRIRTEGFGFDQPVADNKTEAGRTQNRRVEIRSVIKEEKKVRVAE